MWLFLGTSTFNFFKYLVKQRVAANCKKIEKNYFFLKNQEYVRKVLEVLELWICRLFCLCVWWTRRGGHSSDSLFA